MRVLTVPRAAGIWYEQGRPTRLAWGDGDWRVVDTPTRIDATDDAVYSPFITHPPAPWPGWRFTARSESGATYVFDVHELPSGGCEVLRVFE